MSEIDKKARMKASTVMINGKEMTFEEFSDADYLIVDHPLDLSYMPITELPENLVINGSLIISSSDIEYLSEGLIVLGNLEAYNTELEYISSDIREVRVRDEIRMDDRLRKDTEEIDRENSERLWAIIEGWNTEVDEVLADLKYTEIPQGEKPPVSWR